MSDVDMTVLDSRSLDERERERIRDMTAARKEGRHFWLVNVTLRSTPPEEFTVLDSDEVCHISPVFCGNCGETRGDAPCLDPF